MMRYTEGVQAAGESVVNHANNIRRMGEDMYDHLRGLMDSGQLTGEGIAQALTDSQTRWRAACDDFAQAEEDFGNRTQDAYVNMMAADHRGAGYFA